MISENKRELREENKRLALLVACSPDGILMTDERGRIVEWNPALEQLTGITYSSAAGQHIWEILSNLTHTSHQSPEQNEIERVLIQQLLVSGVVDESHQFYVRQFLGSDQTLRTVEVSVFTILTDHGYCLANIIREATTSKAAESQLRISLRAIEQSPSWVAITDTNGHLEYVSPRLTELNRDITTRTEAEQRLRDSESSLNRLQELARIGDWTWFAQTNTVRWSDEMYRIFGVDPTSFKGDLNAVIEAATHPDDRMSVFAASQAVLEEKNPAAMEYRVVSPDGSIRFLWAHPSDCVFDNDGKIVSLSGVVQDITERKLAEIRLHESERFARSIVDALSAEIAIIDELGTVIAVNQAWRSFASANATDTGMLCEGVNYFAVLEAVDPSSEDKATASGFEEGIRSVMNGETETFSLEYPCHSPTEKRWFVGRVTRFAGDGPLRLVVAHENITERKLAEIASQEAHQELKSLHEAVRQHNAQLEHAVIERTVQLRRLNDRMAVILDNTSDAILLVDAENRIEATNQSFERLLGYQRDEVLGQPLRLIADSTFVSELVKAKQTARVGQNSQRVYIKAKCKDGRTIDTDVALTFVKDNSGHMVCSVRDITQLKELERAKDEFVSMASHELRTPITAMVLNSETLSHYYDRLSDEKRLQKVAQLRQQADVLTELVTAILDIARFDSKRAGRDVEHVDVLKTLQEVTSELTQLADGKGQNLIVLAHSTTIAANHSDLALIWRNLIGNAIKYSGDGATIKVRLYAPDRASPSRILSEPDLSAFNGTVPSDIKSGNYLIGMVEDNGPGIRQQDLPQLFTRFFRGWAAGTGIPGTGLGLSLVKDIIQSYGGEITVHSVPQRGTTFCFWLPAGN